MSKNISYQFFVSLHVPEDQNQLFDKITLYEYSNGNGSLQPLQRQIMQTYFTHVKELPSVQTDITQVKFSKGTTISYCYIKANLARYKIMKDKQAELDDKKQANFEEKVLNADNSFESAALGFYLISKKSEIGKQMLFILRNYFIMKVGVDFVFESLNQLINYN